MFSLEPPFLNTILIDFAQAARGLISHILCVRSMPRLAEVIFYFFYSGLGHVSQKCPLSRTSLA